MIKLNLKHPFNKAIACIYFLDFMEAILLVLVIIFLVVFYWGAVVFGFFVYIIRSKITFFWRVFYIYWEEERINRLKKTPVYSQEIYQHLRAFKKIQSREDAIKRYKQIHKL